MTPGRAAPRRGELGELHAVALAAALLVIAAAATLVAEHFSTFDPLSPLFPPVVKALLLVVVVATACAARLNGWLRRHWPDVAAVVPAVFVGAVIAGLLHRTPWPLFGQYGDQQFRTEQVTHFSATWHLSDFAYRGKPAFYPPAWPWLLGRLAALTHTPGWREVKLGEVTACFVVPLLFFWMWRRLLRPAAALAMSLLPSLLLGNLAKPDEWLVLGLILPWWLLAVAGLERPDVRRWPPAVYAAIGGVLFYFYSFYFVPIALISVLWLGVSRFRRYAWTGTRNRTAWVAVIGLVVAAPFVVPTLVAVVTGRPFTQTQFRFADATTQAFPDPLGIVAGERFSHPVGIVLMLAGVAYLAVRSGRDRTASALATAVVGEYALYVVGFLGAALNHPMLVFHAYDLVLYTWMSAGVLGAAAVVGYLCADDGQFRPVVGAASTRVAVVVGLAAALSVGEHFVDFWAAGPAAAAHSAATPSGQLPGYPPFDAERWRGYAVSGAPAADLERVIRAGAGSSRSLVVLTARDDLPTFTPMYTFLHWGSIYSNPQAQYAQRVAFLQRLANTTDPAAFAEQVRRNPFDAIDVFVLKREHRGLVFGFDTDVFPYRLKYQTIVFNIAQFDSRWFRTTQVGDEFVAVINRG